MREPNEGTEGIAYIKTEKSGQTIQVTIPILAVLATTLERGPCGDLAFIVGGNGKPMTKESFGNAFREACNAAGVPGSAHGVRKIAATTAANKGATVAELEALFGWQGGAMAALYTRSANREKLARNAAAKLLNEDRTNAAAPSHPVRRQNQKTR